MAAKRKKKAKTAAAPAGETGDDSSNPPPPLPPTKAQVLGLLAKAALKKASVSSIRPVLPVIEGYGRSQKIVGGKVPDIEKGGPADFSPAEVAVLKTAGEKFAYEFIEMASRSHPVDDKAEPYIAKVDDQTKQYPAPNLSHLLSAFVYGRRVLGFAEDEQDKPAPSPDGGNEEPDTEIFSGRVVLLNAVGQGEYVPKVGAIRPNEIRRIAMSQRQESQRQASFSQQKQIVKTNSPSVKAAGLMQKEPPPAPAAGKCGCHGGGASPESVARYKEDGRCASLLNISCETQWRLRECLKETLCDLLFCASSHLCEDGKFKGFKDIETVVADCFGKAACSLLQCIPNAICPPEPTCKEKPRLCQPCNFAVEEEI